MRDPTRDIARGLTVLEMETVNNSSLNIFAHADVYTNGVTYADTVFPNFVFLAGMSGPMAPKRGVALVGLGLAYNGIASVITTKGEKKRPVGVLQRTGLASLILAILPSMCPRYQLALLGLHTAVTVGLATDWKNPYKTLNDTAQSKIDRAVIGESGLYKPDYDPEGLLGALTTAVSMWLGYYYETFQPDVSNSLQTGGGLIAAGAALSYLLPSFLPLSKPFWTPTFVLLTGGYNILKQTAIKAAIPYLPCGVKCVLKCLGKRSLEVFFSSMIVSSIGKKTGWWNKIKSFFNKYIGETGSDVAMLALNHTLMASLAVFYVRNNIQIRL